MTKRNQHILIVSIFIFALGLRLVLCLVNREANDNHVEVVNWIIDKNEIPQKENCWECFQPKLFYVVDSIIIRNLDIKSQSGRVVCMQLINFVFSFFILLFLWKLIRKQDVSFSIKAWCFALVAFNPCLVGINVQATNDTLEILAGCGVIYYSQLFFRSRKLSDAVRMISFVLLSSIVKSSGIVLIAAMVFVFLVKILVSVAEKRMFLVKAFFIFLVCIIVVVPFAGGYYQNYQKYNTPFVNNISSSALPLSFYKQSFTRRPGITSVVHGYFTFRYFDMMKTPYITNDQFTFPLHRTSLWSQLYGRTFFLHFDQHPGSWISLDPGILAIGRGLLLLGISVVLFFLVGFLESIFRIIKNGFMRNKNYFVLDNNWMNVAFVSAFLLFAIKYSYDYIDFSTMKSIFVFPALLSFVMLFISGISKIKSNRVLVIIKGIFSVIIVLSIYDICFLIHQLW